MGKKFNRIKGLEEVQVAVKQPHETRRYIRLEKQAQPERPKFLSPERRARFFYQPSMAGRCYVCFNKSEILTEVVGGGTQGHKRFWACPKCL